MKRIGFIGLGTMGKPMAMNLIRKGYDLRVYNKTTSKTDECIQLGAKLALSPREATEHADVVITMVTHDEVLKDIFFREDGILQATSAGQTIIDCSTVSAQTSQELYATLRERGVHYLDAPVTGSKPAAESGTLAFMVGGNHEIYEQHQDLFMTMGKKIFYFGPTGSGSYAKIAHNTIVGINAAALIEGAALAVKSGIDLDLFLQIVQLGGANSKQAELRSQKMLERDFDNLFSTKLMLKDLQLASQLTRELQLPAPVLAATANIYQMALSKGLGDEDLLSIMKCYEDWMNQPFS